MSLGNPTVARHVAPGLDLGGAAPRGLPLAPAEPTLVAPADIEAAVDDLAQALRARFLRDTAAMPVDALVRAMRGAIRLGWGCWPPVTAPKGHHPGTHLHEVTLFLVPAMGATEDEAARNWRALARAATPEWEGDE